MATIPWSKTDNGLSVIIDGESYNIKSEDPNYKKALQALALEQWDKIPGLVNKGKAIEQWARGMFTFTGGYLYYGKEQVPSEINDKFTKMATEGVDPAPLMRFWQRLQNNPSWRSVNQTWRFLANANIPLAEDGCFLAYKAVKDDYWDMHTGKTHQYKPGSTISEPRNKVSDDPNESCSYGLHVGAKGYLKGMSNYRNAKTLVVKVDPADVVAVPFDYNSQKMRVCKLYVVGHLGCDLPDTIMLPDILGDEKGEMPVAAKPKAPEPKPATKVKNLDDLVEVVGSEPESPLVVPSLEEKTFATLKEAREEARRLKLPGIKKPGQTLAVLTQRIREATAQPEPLMKEDEADVVLEVNDAGLVKRTREDLEKFNLKDLRKMASREYHIVGASHMPGGREALIQAMLKASR